MVGFQTKLKHAEQVRIFRTIPGLENAEFARLGRPASQHVSQFAETCSTRRCGSRRMPRLRFAGQITGCEGYVESAAIGLLAGRFAAAERLRRTGRLPPPTTAHGALLAHITGGHIETIDAGPRSFQPMNVNFGLFPAADRGPDIRSSQQIRPLNRESAGAQERADQARTRRSRTLDCRRSPGGGSRVNARLQFSGMIWRHARYAIGAATATQWVA